jgi:hypothetical protein
MPSETPANNEMQLTRSASVTLPRPSQLISALSRQNAPDRPRLLSLASSA